MKTDAPRLFAGRFEILDQMTGGSSVVWKARDPHTARLVAIKTPSDLVVATPELLARFVEEARLLGRLSHPGVIRILHFYEKGEADERCHLVTEWRDETLATLIERTDVDWRAKLKIMRRVLEAIAYLHSQGIVHRDIKPQNILLSHDLTTVEVADLGIAGVKGGATSHTARATFRYVAPDALIGGTDGSPQLDIYSLGITFFELFAGRTGFEHAFEDLFRDGHGGPSDVRWLNWQLDASRKLPDLREINPDVPPVLAGVIARMAEKNPALRYKDIAEVSAALAQLGPEFGPSPDDSLQPLNPEDFDKKKIPKKQGLSKRTVIIGGTIAFFLLAIGILVVPELLSRPEAAQPPDPTAQRAALQAAVSSAEAVGMVPDTAALKDAKQLLAAAATPADASALTQATELLGQAIATAPRLAVLGSTDEQIDAALRECNARNNGCAREEFSDEKRREVPLAPFELAPTEVATGEFQKFADSTHWITDPERSGFVASLHGKTSVKLRGVTWRNIPAASSVDPSLAPVRGVAYADAQAYCKWAGMRLPTEDEWEFAAQAASGTLHGTGSGLGSGSVTADPWTPELVAVADFPVSGRFGVHGLAGNVAEWVVPTIDPQGPGVLKGGSYLETDAARRRPAARRLQERTVAHTDDGFRCAKNAPHWPADTSPAAPSKTLPTAHQGN